MSVPLKKIKELEDLAIPYIAAFDEVDIWLDEEDIDTHKMQLMSFIKKANKSNSSQINIHVCGAKVNGSLNCLLYLTHI